MPRIEWQAAVAPIGPGWVLNLDTGETSYPPELAPRDKPMCDFCSYEGRPVYLPVGDLVATIAGFMVKSEHPLAGTRTIGGDWSVCRKCQAMMRIKDGDTWVKLEVVKRIWLRQQRPITRWHMRQLGLPASILKEERFTFMEV